MGANQGMAGSAYSNVQRRVQSLRDQGIQQGQLQTEAAYNRGTAAKDRAQQAAFDMQGAEGTYMDRQGKLRDERGNLVTNVAGSKGRVAGTEMDMRLGRAGLAQQLATGTATRRAGLLSAAEAQKRGLSQGEIDSMNAQQAGRLGFAGGIFGAGAQVAGSLLSKGVKSGGGGGGIPPPQPDRGGGYPDASGGAYPYNQQNPLMSGFPGYGAQQNQSRPGIGPYQSQYSGNQYAGR
jgi:hypothetical protein